MTKFRLILVSSTFLPLLFFVPITSDHHHDNRHASHQAAKCEDNEFACTNGLQCVNMHDVMDFKYDCADKSDELFFSCRNDGHGPLIHSLDVCDGYFHCMDGSDENEESCKVFESTCPSPTSTFQCINTRQCIPIRYQCNGFDDCSDGSDEEDCEDQVNPYEFFSSNICTAIWGIFNMLLGTFGNCMTMIAIPYAVKKKRHGLYKNWWSSTIFIVQLAFYDGLFCSFGMLETIIHNMGCELPFGSTFCNVSIKILPLIVQSSWYALGCVAVTTACFVGYHSDWTEFCTKPKAILIMICPCIFNILTSLPQLLDQTQVSYYNDFTGVCETKDLTVLKGMLPTFSSGWLKLSHYLAFTITCFLIFASYFFIWLQMRKSSKMLKGALKGNMKFVGNKERNERRFTITIFLVCVCFLIFVLPLIISEFLHVKVPSNIIIGLYWTQYSINFVIYAGRRDAFQKAYMDIINMVLPKAFSVTKQKPAIKISTADYSTRIKTIHNSQLPSTRSTVLGSEQVASTSEPISPRKQENNLPEVIEMSVAIGNEPNKQGTRTREISECVDDVFTEVKPGNDQSIPMNLTKELQQIRQCLQKVLSKVVNWVQLHKKLLFVIILVFSVFGTIFWIMGEINHLNTTLVVIGGFTEQTSDTEPKSVHILDMEKTSTCDIQSLQLKGNTGAHDHKHELRDLPDILIGAKGTLFKDTPIICGGLDNPLQDTISDKCYRMESQHFWADVSSMSIGRQYHAMAVVDNKIIVCGGWDTRGYLTDTVEFLSDLTSDSWMPGKSMPHLVAGHCLVALNNEEIMSIGGIDENYQSSNKTWIYNINDEIWRDGKPMLKDRFYHGCSMIEDGHGKSFAIVAGGSFGRWQNSTITATVEVYDPSTNIWYDVADLPKAIAGGQLIKDGRGGVLMVGGDDIGLFDGYLSDIFYLSGKDGTWKKTFKHIDVPSAYHVALLIPDSFVMC